MSLAVAKAEVFSVLPLHTNQISAFYIDKFEVTKALWDGVYQWAITNGYSFDYGAHGKATNHPAHTVTWHDAVKWCTRSPRSGRYRCGARTFLSATVRAPAWEADKNVQCR